MQQLEKKQLKTNTTYILASQSTVCFCNANLSPQNLGALKNEEKSSAPRTQLLC